MPELRFFPWDDPFLPAAASALLDMERFRTHQSVDLRDTLVVVPGARAGRRLLELLVETAAARDLRLVPPHRILTVGVLPEELYRPGLPISTGATARRGWVRAMEEASGDTLEAALGPAAAESDASGKVPFARLLERLNRTVGGGGISFRAVAAECRRGFLFSDEARWEALSGLQEGMRRALRDVGQMDREEARQEALRTGAISTGRTPVLVGIAELPLVTRRILEKIQGDLLVFVQAPQPLAEGFDAFGTVRADFWQDRSVPIPEESLVVADGPVDQAAEVGRAVRDLADTYGRDEITIGVPDPSIVPYLAQQLESRGIPARYAEGTPLAVTAPVQLLQATADYLGSRRFTSLANLLRHPDLPAALDPITAPERADEYFERHLPFRVEPGRLLKGRDADGLARIESVLNGPGFMGKFKGMDTVSEWMPRILSFLAGVYEDFSSPPRSKHRSRVLEASVQIRDAAESLSHLPPALDEECSSKQALRILLGELRDGRIPPEKDESAVEMVGWLELQLDDAPVIFLTGVSDPFLPESVNADPYLPNALRSRLGLADNRARYARDAYRLTALVEGTDMRLIVAGRRNASGDPLVPSRLLLTGTDEELADRILRLTGEKSGPRDGRAPEVRTSEPTESQRFLLPPEPRIPLSTLPQPLPVTAFRSILADPYLWALQRVLHLEEPAYDLQELDPMSFGNLAHGVLEEFARSSEVESSDPDEILAGLNKILNRRVQGHYGPDALPAVSLQVEQLRTRLGAFSEWQAGRAEEGWRIVCAEARTPPSGVPFDVDGDPVFLSGRIDRIDRHLGTGAWAVFDYKTGEGGVSLTSVRGNDGEWKDLQLPLYRHLLDHLLTPQGVPLEPPQPGVHVDLAYLPIPKDQGPLKAVEPDWTEEDLAAAQEAARKVIRSIREAGEVSFDPSRSGRQATGGFAALLGYGLLQEEEGAE